MPHVVVGICSRTRADGQEEYLLVRTKADYGEQTGWYQPAGGKMEEGETEEQALMREFKEELGVDVVLGEKLVETDGDRPGFRVSWWAVTLPPTPFVVQESELAEVSFLTRAEIDRTNVWPATRKFFEEYIWNK